MQLHMVSGVADESGDLCVSSRAGQEGGSSLAVTPGYHNDLRHYLISYSFLSTRSAGTRFAKTDELDYY